MATKTKQLKLDATRPFYAAIGAGDLAVEFARTAAAELQGRFGKVDLEPKALREQARAAVNVRVEEFNKEARDAQARFEDRIDELQAEARALPGRIEDLVTEYVEELNEAYGELASRGRTLVTRIRRQQSTNDAVAHAETTVAKAKTGRTQTSKAAKSGTRTTKSSATKTARTARSTAKKTAGAASTNARATGTAAAKTASSAGKASGDAAAKVGD